MGSAALSGGTRTVLVGIAFGRIPFVGVPIVMSVYRALGIGREATAAGPVSRD